MHIIAKHTILYKMNYLLISDIMWYSGHILSGMSVIFTHNNHYLSASFVVVGQLITIVSRPIGRIQPDKQQKIVATEYEQESIV